MKISETQYCFNHAKKHHVRLKHKKILDMGNTERESFFEFLRKAITKNKLNDIEQGEL